MKTKKAELVVIDTPELAGIEKSKAEQIKATFAPMVEMLEGFESRYQDVIKKSKQGITLEVEGLAKRLRLDMSKVRIETGKLKDSEKAEYLRAANAIQGVHNILVWAVSDKESELKKIEDARAIIEKERLEKLQNDRAEKLLPFVSDAYEMKLAEMQDDVWDAYFEKKKKDHEDKIAAEKQAELDRAAKEKAEAEERERIRLENIRLQKEAEFREAQMKKEREAAEKALADERAKAESQRKEAEAKAAKERAELEAKERVSREAAEKAQSELKAKKEAEEKAIADAEAAKIKAAKAPIKVKLNTWVDSFSLPSTDVDNPTTNIINEKFNAFKAWAKTQVQII